MLGRVLLVRLARHTLIVRQTLVGSRGRAEGRNSLRIRWCTKELQRERLVAKAPRRERWARSSPASAARPTGAGGPGHGSGSTAVLWLLVRLSAAVAPLMGRRGSQFLARDRRDGPARRGCRCKRGAVG